MTDQLGDDRLIQALACELGASNRVAAARLRIADSDLAVLDLLYREGPQRPTTLARRTGLANSTITGVLLRLERGGWIRRRPNQEDLRSFTIDTIDTIATISTIDAVDTPDVDAPDVGHDAALPLIDARRFAHPARLYSPAERDLLVDLLHRATAAIRRATDELADQP